MRDRKNEGLTFLVAQLNCKQPGFPGELRSADFSGDLDPESLSFVKIHRAFPEGFGTWYHRSVMF